MSTPEAWPPRQFDAVHTSFREWLDENAPDDETIRPRRRKTSLLRTLARTRGTVRRRQ